MAAKRIKDLTPATLPLPGDLVLAGDSTASGEQGVTAAQLRDGLATAASVSTLATTVGGKADATATTAALALKLDATLATVFNAASYGLTTGNTAAANTTALQAAVTAAAVTGGTVYIPPAASHYLINTIALPVGGNVAIVGGSAGSQMPSDLGATAPGSVLRSGSAVPMFAFNGGSGNPVGAAGLVIRDITLDGNSLGTIGLDWTRAAYFVVERVTIRRFVVAGVKLTGSLVGEFKSCWIGDTNYRGVWAIKTTSGTTIKPNLVSFTGCRICANATWAVDWSGGNHVVFQGCDFELNGSQATPDTGAIKFTPDIDGVGLIVQNTWFEANRGPVVVQIENTISAVAAYHSMRDCLFVEKSFANPTYCVQLGGGGAGENHLTLDTTYMAHNTAPLVRLTGPTAILHQGQGVWAVSNAGGVPLTAWPPTPPAFSFTDNLSAATSTVTASNTVTLTGDTSALDTWPVTVDAPAGTPEIQVNGGTWTNSRVPAAVARSGDTLAVRMTSSATGGTVRTATVRAGGRSTVWSLAPTILPADIFPSGLVIDLVAGPAWCFSDAGGTTPCAANDPVYVWKTRTGSYSFAQATLGNRPLLKSVSGKWVVDFSQSLSHRLISTTAIPTGRNTAGWTLGVATKLRNVGYMEVFGFSTGASATAMRAYPLTPQITYWDVNGRRLDGDGYVNAVSANAVANNTNQQMITVANLTAGTITGYLGTTQILQGTGLTTGLTTDSDSLRVTIGDRPDLGRPWEGTIGALVFANVSADATQRANSATYLSSTLPT